MLFNPYSTVDDPLQVLIPNGYTRSLGTGLKDGDELGCAIISGLTITETGKLTCVVKWSYIQEMPAYVMIYGFDSIAPNTAIRVLIGGI